MPRFTFDRRQLPQTSLVIVSTLGALALLAWVLAYWSWIWLLPRPEPRGEDLPVAAANASTLGALFGVAPRAAGTPATSLALKLQGVVAAAADRRGYAILQIDAKKIAAVLVGDEIAPGVKLAEVHPDHVILERGGLRETLNWPPKSVTTPPPPVTR